MSGAWYVDTSALVKVVHAEQWSDELRTFVAGHDVTSSAIVRTELRRATEGAADEVAVALEELLDGLAVMAVSLGVLDVAGRLSGPLRSLDAIHVASAMALGDDAAGFVTYDRQQGARAAAQGLRVVAPGVVQETGPGDEDVQQP